MRWWEAEIRRAETKRAAARRDCLTMVLAALFVAFALVSVLVATEVRPPGRQSVARAGEWVTRPGGARVCRVMADVGRDAAANPRAWCADWQEPPPQPLAPLSSVPWARLGPGGGLQFMVEGRWRP